MNVQTFFQESGFKLLALAHLSQTEYSLVLYLLNCAVSGMDQVVTNESELASLIGFEDTEITKAIDRLFERNIIKLHIGRPKGQSPGPQTAQPSLRLGMQFSTGRWKIDVDKDLTAQDAIVYPFRRSPQESNLYVLGKNTDSASPSDDVQHIGERGAPALSVCGQQGGQGDSSVSPLGSMREKDTAKTAQRVVDSFVQSRPGEDIDLEATSEAARVLVETHPVDQVLIMLRHFGTRIPSLSLLASSWQPYLEMFESETQKVDIFGARTKHIQLDQHVREEALSYLEQRESLKLTSDEVDVLQILIKHRHPRRQLFWAYQARSRYPHLAQFFKENSKHMLAVTSAGAVIKKKLDRPDPSSTDS